MEPHRICILFTFSIPPIWAKKKPSMEHTFCPTEGVLNTQSVVTQGNPAPQFSNENHRLLSLYCCLHFINGMFCSAKSFNNLKITLVK